MGYFARNIPGMFGIVTRNIFYKLLFKRLRSLVLVYPGVYLTHTYGMDFGRNCSVNSGAVLDGRGGISVGDYVMIGPNVCIASSSHNHKDIKTPISVLGHKMKPVRIKSGVWIGANATILGGVTIGRGSVVGAGAVVTKDVDDFTIVAGVPAKNIGTRK